MGEAGTQPHVKTPLVGNSASAQLSNDNKNYTSENNSDTEGVVVVFGESAKGIGSVGGWNGDAEANDDDSDTPDSRLSRLGLRLVALAKKYQLVICFAVAIIIGLAWPTPGVKAGTKVGDVSPFAIICVMIIFLLNGLKLKPR